MPPMPTPDTKAFTKPVAQSNHGWKVILYNDDVTPVEVVVYALQRAAGLSEEVSEMVCLEAHEKGLAMVRSGLPETEAKIICAGLQRWSRIPDVCPGVECEALPDENS